LANQDNTAHGLGASAAHGAATPVMNQEMGVFVNKFLLGRTNVDTNIRDDPASYSSIDFARWTAWRGTTKPVFAN